MPVCKSLGTIGWTGEDGKGRAIGDRKRDRTEREKEEPYYQVDLVDGLACLERPLGDTQVRLGYGTVMVSRLCERAKSLAPCPDIQGPSFLRDELVKFIESAKLGGKPFAPSSFSRFSS